MLVYCWVNVVDDGPTIHQHWINVSCLLGWQLLEQHEQRFVLDVIFIENTQPISERQRSMACRGCLHRTNIAPMLADTLFDQKRTRRIINAARIGEQFSLLLGSHNWPCQWRTWNQELVVSIFSTDRCSLILAVIVTLETLKNIQAHFRTTLILDQDGGEFNGGPTLDVRIWHLKTSDSDV